MLKRFYFLFAAMLLWSLNSFNSNLQPNISHRYKWEQFSPALAMQLSSVSSMQQYVDSVATNNHISKGAIEYVDIIAQVIKLRFYHGYSNYSLKENWIAVLAGKLCWSHLSAIVLPDDLLKYPMAACSQQELVFIDFLHRNRIDFRKIIFKHHFALEARIGNNWYYFDTNMEPVFVDGKRESLEDIIDKKQLTAIYAGRIRSSDIDSVLGKPDYGPVNEMPASNAKLFHRVTKFISHWLWLLPMFLFLRQFMKKPVVKAQSA